MCKVKVGVIGLGFVGKIHFENIRRIPNTEIEAIVTRNPQKLEKWQKDFDIELAYTDYRDLLGIADELDVIHNCTPNQLHYPINKSFIEKGVDIISEKPLALNFGEAQELVELASKKGIMNAICFNYRYYPLIQEMKDMIERGYLGEIRIVHGHYLQDWLFQESDYNWRLEADKSGKTRTVSDIGSHWMDTVQFLCDKEITRLCAMLKIFIKKRKKPVGDVETFQESNLGDYTEITVDTEDYASVIFEMESGISGNMILSQISAGRKNYFDIEISGSKRSVYWNQEEPHKLWIGERGSSNQVIMSGPNLLSERAQKYALLPAGHNEGWSDAQKNLLLAIYNYKQSRDQMEENNNITAIPEFSDGLRTMAIEEAILKSAKEGIWVNI